MKKFVYSFNEGSKEMYAILGNKGANLAEMTRIGLPVPFGFTITTTAHKNFYEDGHAISDEITEEIFVHLADLENVTGKKYGEASNPLLLSVRSGSAFSMPGMMKTILNVGINDETVKGLAEVSGNERFAYDAYRRLIEMFGCHAFNIAKSEFDDALESVKSDEECTCETEVCTESLKKLVEEYKKIIKSHGEEFPQDVRKQLIIAATVLFESWDDDINVMYRTVNKISEEPALAINVEHMVFGNIGEDSGIGIAYTRNTQTGEKVLTGEFLYNAQGEDVVKSSRKKCDISELEKSSPAQYKQFLKIAEILEKHYKDIQFIEFTIEDGRLFILQTRTASRTSAAALKAAVDMVEEGLIDKKTALMRVKTSQIEMLISQAMEADGVQELFADESFSSFIKWTEEFRNLKIRATADDINQARKAVLYGCEGIGLFRTEIITLQSLYAKDIFEDLKDSFIRLFEITQERPVGIRLFNPVFSEQHNIDAYELIEKQARAIVAAVHHMKTEHNIEVFPGIIVPLIGLDKEYITVKSIVVNAISKYLSENDVSIAYSIGPMIDVPRVALTADDLTKEADFFSFELDNLTNRTFGFSMDEPVSFITKYRESIELERDMFTGFDSNGVGRLVKNAAVAGKNFKSNLKLGVCKEYDVDIDMIDFCTMNDFNYISCAADYIHASKLAAVQSALKLNK